jgi:uncharacterized protein YuzE
MKVKFDKETDALYFRLNEKSIVESEEIQPGVILDYDQNNQVVGVEFLKVSMRTDAEQLSSMHFQTAG